MHVAELLRTVRSRSGLSLRALAVRADTSHSTLAAYESGSKHPTTRTLLRVIDAADFSVDFDVHPRYRISAQGLDRGEELRQVLELAEQFPAEHAPLLSYPVFRQTGGPGVSR